ncbi:MAG: hypothetical protein Q9167_004273 [Letrouitia subvulpina]
MEATNFSYPSGQPPTPTRTPTSATFAQSFETPKQESSFFDPRVTWDTANPWATSPELWKTPQYPSFGTPGKSPVTPSGTKRPLSSQDLEAQIASHVHHLSPNPCIPLPPVEPSRQLSSSPNPLSSAKRPCPRASETELTPLKTGLDQDPSSSMHSASSMQTPPPTGTSASRRKAQQAQVAKLAKQTTISGRRMSSPSFQHTENGEAPSLQIESSPGFPSLQFSPEGFSFPMSGPATAPVFPQHKLFWDPEQSNDSMNLDFANNDFFALGIAHEKSTDPFTSQQTQTAVTTIPSSSFNGLEGSQDDLAMFPVSAKAPAKKFSKSKLTASVVDPALLFSSPGRTSELHNLPPSSQSDLNDTLQPYAHQIQDAKREDEMRLGSKPKRRRGPETDSPAVKAALQTLRDEDNERPNLKRSITDSVLKSFDENAPPNLALRGHMLKDPPRRRSPSQKQAHYSSEHALANRRLKKQTTLTLTIDASGRAKTEAKFVGEQADLPTSSKMDVDSLSAESESSSSEEEDYVTSRHQSFNASRQKPAKIKITRFATDSKTHSQKSSYASTLASNSTGSGAFVQATSKTRIPSNLSYPSSGPSHLSISISDQESSSTIISDRLDGKEIETELETVVDSDEGRGDAQSELKKVIRNRSQRKANQPVIPNPQTQRSTQYPDPSYGGQLAPYPYHDALTPSHQSYHNVSPTTITAPNYTTLHSHADSQTSDNIRCVCHVQDSDGEPMIMW